MSSYINKYLSEKVTNLIYLLEKRKKSRNDRKMSHIQIHTWFICYVWTLSFLRIYLMLVIRCCSVWLHCLFLFRQQLKNPLHGWWFNEVRKNIFLSSVFPFYFHQFFYLCLFVLLLWSRFFIHSLFICLSEKRDRSHIVKHQRLDEQANENENQKEFFVCVLQKYLCLVNEKKEEEEEDEKICFIRFGFFAIKNVNGKLQQCREC